jgi:hypothetical protein
MQVIITASGLPAQVHTAVATQIKQARKDNPEGSAAIDSLRDYVAKVVSACGPEDEVVVEASIDVRVYQTPKAKAAPMEEVEQ